MAIAVVVQLVLGVALSGIIIAIGLRSGQGLDAGFYERLMEPVVKYFTQGMPLLILNGLAELILLACFGLWYYFRENKYPFRPDYRKAFTAKNVLCLCGIGFFGQYAINLILTFLYVAVPGVFKEYENLVENFNIDIGSPVLMIFFVCLFGPLVEEVIFRGMIYGKLRRAFSILPSAVISGVIFGIYHMNWVQGIYAAIFGILLAYVYERTQTIWGSVLLHVIFNSSSYIISGYEGAMEKAGIEVPGAFLLIFDIICVGIVILLLRHFRIRKPDESIQPGAGQPVRLFEKSEKLHGVCYDVRGPVLDEANAMKRRGMNILQLNIGNPAPFGFTAPEWITNAAKKALENPMSQGYSESNGILEAREAIREYHLSKGLPNIDVDHIYMGNGVSEMISLAMQGLLNNGDEILIPAPDYPLWTAAAKLAGGNPVHYICDESSNWYPDITDMERKITSRTKGIVIINPNNPTGALYPREVLERIVLLARKYQLVIFSDEIYDRLVFDGKEHTSIASLAPDLFVVTFNGLSKSDRIAGFRSGWMVLSGDLSKGKGYIEGINMLSSMRLCANVLAQHVVAPALRNRPEIDPLLLPGGRLYEQRKCICEAVEEVDGLSAVRPDAAFYIFPKVDAKRFGITNDERFVLEFLRKKRVMLVHGGGFNWAEPDHFRIVYLPEVRVLKEAMFKLDDFLQEYYR